MFSLDPTHRPSDPAPVTLDGNRDTIAGRAAAGWLGSRLPVSRGPLHHVNHRAGNYETEANDPRIHLYPKFLFCGHRVQGPVPRSDQSSRHLDGYSPIEAALEIARFQIGFWQERP